MVLFVYSQILQLRLFEKHSLNKKLCGVLNILWILSPCHLLICPQVSEHNAKHTTASVRPKQSL